MKDAYIVCPIRSAVGKAFRGGLAHKRPDDLAADLIRGLLTKISGLDNEALIEDVILGCAMPEAEQGMNVARIAALLAGLPQEVPGLTINRFCSSGVQSIAMAAQRVQLGDADCLLAGGTESMTMVPMMGHKVVGSRRIMEEHPEIYINMGLTAENVAQRYQISREDQDAFAYQSHKRAIEAQKNGDFNDEILPIEVIHRSYDERGQLREDKVVFDQDDGPRADTSLEALAKLKPAFKVNGTVTAGNSSQMSDGAGICMVCSEDFIKKHQLTPLARFRGFAVAGVAPEIMGIGPVVAIPKVLKKAGIKKDDIDWIELNEAFAAQSLAVIRDLDLNPEIVNPCGGAIALGHPLGATGAKLTATALHGLKRHKKKWALVTMCIGTGMGAACLFEAV